MAALALALAGVCGISADAGLARGSRTKKAITEVSKAQRAQSPQLSEPDKPSWQAKASNPRSADEVLRELAQALRDAAKPAEKETAYRALQEYARQHTSQTNGQRAALALGHYDFERKRYAQAHKWFELAIDEPLLASYSLYWRALSARALGRPASALSELEDLRSKFAGSVPAGLAVEPIAELALALGRPARALIALVSHPANSTDPALMFLRGRALESAGQRREASAAFAVVFFVHPLHPAANTAGVRLMIWGAGGTVSVQQKLNRAEKFFEARLWREARAEFTKLAAQLTGAARETALLRTAQCRSQIEKRPAALERLALTESSLEAERLVSLAAAHRVRGKEGPMLSALDTVAAKYPRSPWAEEALLAAGNFFWSQLDRRRAVAYYEQLWRLYPESKQALLAHWRTTWVAYLEGDAGAREALETHLRKFPPSPYATNALYWLGRTAERAGNFPRARGFYAKLLQRHPQNYFGFLAGQRLREIGATPVEEAEVLAIVGPVPQLALDAEIPAGARPAWARAQALRGIALHAEAESEFRAANAAQPSQRLLLEAARAAVDAGRMLPGISAARQAVPQLESRRLQDVPEEIWRAVYPLEFNSGIESHSARSGLDPMMVAALIRQESVFQPRAVSRVGARGLMQLYPPTGRLLARKMKLRYSRARLFDPEFNLRLGTAYLAELYRMLGGWEAALAAYNAGENRVVKWRAERPYNEPAEFVESIPITETREYVQIVIRNAEIYRALYGRNLSAAAAK